MSKSYDQNYNHFYSDNFGKDYTKKRSFQYKTILRWILFTAIITYLIYQLTRIGWSEIILALPTSPLFYLLSLCLVLAPITAEALAFQTITGQSFRPAFKVFGRKHVLNKAVINFSGDAYAVNHLSQNNGMSVREAIILMKDMTLIRAFIANFWIIGLVVIALLLGQSASLQEVATTSSLLTWTVGGLALCVCGGIILFFRKVTRLKLDIAGKVAGIYLFRSIVVAIILISQWSIVISGVSLSTWFMFLILFHVTKKSPIGGDFVFVSVVVSLPNLGAESASIAAMLLSITAVIQVIYVAGFLLTMQREQQNLNPAA